MSTNSETQPSADELVYNFRRERPARLFGKLAVFGLLVAVLGLLGWQLYGDGGGNDSKSVSGAAVNVGGALTHKVTKGRLLVTVVAAGNMESAENKEVKCQVTGGGSIQWIVEDGTEVKEGDLIVKLDSSTIEEQLTTQKIGLGKALASKIQAQENSEAAQIAVEEYIEGTYLKDLQIADANINIAQENLRSSENLLEHTRKMSRKGFTTALQVEADEFAVERSKLELESAKTSKNVLVKFSRKKILKELEAKLEAAKALETSEEAAFKLEEIKLQRLERQLLNCEIKAPQNGIVIYANDQGGRGFSSGSGPKIELHATVREAQTILRLPDLSKMQVKMLVHESKIGRLKEGMLASVKTDKQIFQGKIIKIGTQPENASWMNANLKEYATTVKIEGQTEGLKTSMTAEVEVLIEDREDVLTVPVTCVVEQRGTFYAWVVKGPNSFERQELTVGFTNDKDFEIQRGLTEGDLVLLNPKATVSEARSEEPRGDSSADDPSKKFGGAAPKGVPNGQKNESNGSEKKVAKNDKAAQGDTKSGPPRATTVAEFMKLDADGDEKISKTEAPEQMQAFFDRIDTDQDGSLSKSEVGEMFKRARERQQQGGGAGGPGGPSAVPGGQ